MPPQALAELPKVAAMLSSTRKNNVAANCIDGVVDGLYCLSNPNQDTNVTLEVDMGGPHRVAYVVLHNRHKSMPKRFIPNESSP